ADTRVGDLLARRQSRFRSSIGAPYGGQRGCLLPAISTPGHAIAGPWLWSWVDYVGTCRSRCPGRGGRRRPPAVTSSPGAGFECCARREERALRGRRCLPPALSGGLLRRCLCPRGVD